MPTTRRSHAIRIARKSHRGHGAAVVRLDSFAADGIGTAPRSTSIEKSLLQLARDGLVIVRDAEGHAVASAARQALEIRGSGVARLHVQHLGGQMTLQIRTGARRPPAALRYASTVGQRQPQRTASPSPLPAALRTDWTVDRFLNHGSDDTLALTGVPVVRQLARAAAARRALPQEFGLALIGLLQPVSLVLRFGPATRLT